jgi:hypothetical protein
MSEPLRVLSLGAGVQSSAVLLMNLAGELGPRLDAAIFADTGGEPAAVYEHLGRLGELAAAAGLPLLTVREGDGLEAAERDPDRHGFSQVPYHVHDGRRPRMTRRQCTSHFKLTPIRRKVRELAAGRPVEQWIGISLDEVHRMRDSGVGWVTNHYPLVEARLTRHDCLLWMERAGHPRPPRSACYFCPMHNTADWRDLRDNHPEAWAAAVAYDEGLRAGQFPAKGLESPRFLHYSGRPLAQVDLSTPAEHGQLDLFGAECQGMCGV